MEDEIIRVKVRVEAHYIWDEEVEISREDYEMLKRFQKTDPDSTFSESLMDMLDAGCPSSDSYYDGELEIIE